MNDDLGKKPKVPVDLSQANVFHGIDVDQTNASRQRLDQRAASDAEWYHMRGAPLYAGLENDPDPATRFYARRLRHHHDRLIASYQPPEDEQPDEN